MGIFAKISGKTEITRKSIAERTNALIYCVIEDIELRGLLNGSIVLNDDFTVAFRNGNGQGSITPDNYSHICTSVYLQEVPIGNEFDIDNKYDSMRHILIDRITFAVLDEFAKRLQSFANLDDLFSRKARCVLVCKSEAYLNALKLKDNDLLAELQNKKGEVHYLMESYESPGLAKQRQYELRDSFKGGVVDSYELRI